MALRWVRVILHFFSEHFVHGLVQHDAHLLLDLLALLLMTLIHWFNLLLRVLRIQRLVNFVLGAVGVLNLPLVLLERVRELVLLEMFFAVISALLEHAIVQVHDLVPVLLFDAFLQVEVVVVTVLLVVIHSLFHLSLLKRTRRLRLITEVVAVVIILAAAIELYLLKLLRKTIDVVHACSRDGSLVVGVPDGAGLHGHHLRLPTSTDDLLHSSRLCQHEAVH